MGYISNKSKIVLIISRQRVQVITINYYDIFINLLRFPYNMLNPTRSCTIVPRTVI